MQATRHFFAFFHVRKASKVQRLEFARAPWLDQTMAGEAEDGQWEPADATTIEFLASALGALAVSDGVGDNAFVDIDPLLLNWRPEPLEDCPICMIPLNRDKRLNTYLVCCGKMVCSSCFHLHDMTTNDKNEKRAEKELPPLPVTCPFCRTPLSSGEASIEMNKKRAKKGDAQAMLILGSYHRDGSHGQRKDERKAIELFQRAADAGFADAISMLGSYYAYGMHGLEQDIEKGVAMLQKAIQKGNHQALHCLGLVAHKIGDIDGAVKLLRTAAASGNGQSVKTLWDFFRNDDLSKIQLEESLKANQEANEGMKSEARDRHAKWLAWREKQEEGGEEEESAKVNAS